MPRKLNDTQIAELVFKYTNGTSISALAREYEVSRTSVARYIERSADLVQKCASKKEETTRTMLEYLANNQGKAQNLLDMLLDLTEADIKKASLRDRMGAVKIIAETFGVAKPDTPTGNDDTVIQVEIVNNAKKG